MFKELSRSQQVLLLILYGFLILVIIFSIIAAINNFGEKGMQKCIDKLTEKKINGSIPERPKDLYNCCLGAGGKMVQAQDGSYTCVFD